MSTNDDVWRRPPGDTAGQPAIPPAARLPRSAPRPEDAVWARPPQSSDPRTPGANRTAATGATGATGAETPAGTGAETPAGTGAETPAGTGAETPAGTGGPGTDLVSPHTGSRWGLDGGHGDAAYSGPPPTNPPPPNWRPSMVAEPMPPRTLPRQDHDRLDVEEQAASTLTTGIGLVAGAILIVLLLLLCARVVF
jgi:hypothetical protein